MKMSNNCHHLIDPPYRTSTVKNYHRHFEDTDFIQLNEVLRGINGKFFLSINDDIFSIELLIENY